ncbi:DUF2993 domain-containing protein [Nostoc sp. PA-18-2419]|uniref:LmeA family phospholipid-binding protein n=1 Tax=Nostoc sp. PA-18-2419 TaxID=2575443 RepID=UPI00110996E5|nr:DUF2993 domain-containing protein [Nostoc sp. PA-18-2419]
MSDNPGLGEQALNKGAEIAISSQLDEVENLDINIKTDPLKVVQGEIDAVTIEGEGLVIQKDLRMEKLEMQMSSVAINPLSVALGKIELTKPTEAKTLVILTEADINRAFNSEYVRSQLQNQKIHINGEQRTIELQHVDFKLPGEQKVVINASVKLVETGENQEVGFSAVPSIDANGKSVSLKNVEYSESEEISPDLTKALIDQTSEILNLSNFDLEGISLKINQLKVEVGKLTLEAQAYVEQIPSA